MDATVEVCGVLTKQTHEDRGQDEEQHVAYLKRDTSRIRQVQPKVYRLQ